jgi:hypothetical protein
MPQNPVRVSQAAAWDRALVPRCLPQLGPHAKARRRGGLGIAQVPQLSKAFWGNEGVLECSGLTELGMGRERADGKIQSGVQPPQSKKEGCGISRGDAETRRVGDRPSAAVTKAFWGSEGVLECSGLTELWMGIERVEGEDPKRCQATAVQERRIRNLTRRREDAKTRRVGERVPQLSKAFWGSEGVLECSGSTELWMGRERVDGKIQSGVQPPQSKKEGCGISRGDAETRRVGDRPSAAVTKAFWGSEGVLECSGLTELWMGIERVEGEDPKRCQATAVQERRIRNLTRRREDAKGWGESAAVAQGV